MTTVFRDVIFRTISCMCHAPTLLVCFLSFYLTMPWLAPGYAAHYYAIGMSLFAATNRNCSLFVDAV